MVSAQLFLSRAQVGGSWRYRGACHCSFVGRVHSQGVFSPAQSEKAESWPPRVSGSQISPQDCSAVFCILCDLVHPERGWLFCDEKSPTGGGRPGEPRVRGITAWLDRAGLGEGEVDSIPSTWSECCPRNRSRCTARKRVSLERCRRRTGAAGLLTSAMIFPFWGSSRYLASWLWGQMSVSRNSRCGPLLAWLWPGLVWVTEIGRCA